MVHVSVKTRISREELSSRCWTYNRLLERDLMFSKADEYVEGVYCKLAVRDDGDCPTVSTGPCAWLSCIQ